MQHPFLKQIIELLKKHSEIKLGYFFGSRATGEAGPMSDYDFAFYIDRLSEKERFQLKIELQPKISLLLKTDDVDVVILNDLQATELAYNIIKEGLLFYEEGPYQLTVEPRIMNEYFDFMHGLRRNNLTSV